MTTRLTSNALIVAVLFPFCVIASSENTPRHAIHGTVIDSTTQQPLSWIRISLADTKQRTLSGLTRDDGGFDIFNVGKGVYTLTVDRDGYAPFRKLLHVTDDVASIEVRLQPNGVGSKSARLFGTVVDSASAAPIEYASVQVIGTGRGTFTGPGDNRFLIEGIPPGSYDIAAMALSYHVYRFTLTLEAGDDRYVRIRMRKNLQ